MDKSYFRHLARYNRWANDRLYAACAALPEADLVKARPSFFGSILATLNHILVGDRLWMGRFEGKPAKDIVSLGQILHPDFEGLRAARQAFDDHIVGWFDQWDAHLDQPFAYRTMSGDAMETPLGLTVAHFFNHGTHHRGQVHGLLSATEVEPPPLDLLYFVRDGQA